MNVGPDAHMQGERLLRGYTFEIILHLSTCRIVILHTDFSSYLALSQGHAVKRTAYCISISDCVAIQHSPLLFY